MGSACQTNMLDVVSSLVERDARLNLDMQVWCILGHKLIGAAGFSIISGHGAGRKDRNRESVTAQ